MTKMDYLITGGNGFIGRNLCTRLSREGKAFSVIDINATGNLDTHILDVAYRLPAFYGDTIVHLAADTNVRQSLAHPRTTINRNCQSTMNCIDLLRTEKFNRLIFTSSASSWMSTSPYLASKSCCEAVCQSYKTSYNLDIKVLKLSSVYGPRSIHKNSVVSAFIKRCLDKLPLVIFGDGSQQRDFIYVDDVVDAIISGKSGYICTGKLTPISKLVDLISAVSYDLTKYVPTVRYEQFIPGEVKIPEVHCDIETKVSIEEGIYNTFKWFMENYSH